MRNHTLKWLTRFSLLVCGLMFLWLNGIDNFAFAAPEKQVRHGLTGYYYVANLEAHREAAIVEPGSVFYQQIWFDGNDFQLPKPAKNPAATRIDSKIAFGKGMGFAPRDGKQVMWWPADYAAPPGWPDPKSHPSLNTAAAIWRGYIHLPKAGTYYFATVASGASAVYLNQARVALNGIFGGILNADAFAYSEDDIHDWIFSIASGTIPSPDVQLRARPSDTYVVPVTIDAPRDLPIEVDVNLWDKGRAGIDLFWITPDATHDATGKPVAKVVPSDVLYVDPPDAIEQPAVRGANSTISGNFFYLPADGATYATVKIRLADQNGKPVAGKRVHLSGLVSYGRSDILVQPEKPTDENGNTSAQIAAGEGYKVAHDSTLFATDLDDLVDVAQVAHITMHEVPEISFFPNTYSPYYDNNIFVVDPDPPVVGQPSTISLPLMNHGQYPAELTATFSWHEQNIGAPEWNEIGKVERITLQPGEEKEIHIQWTPPAETIHFCIKIELSGRYLSMNFPWLNGLLGTVMPLSFGERTLLPNAPKMPSLKSLQRNFGPVVRAAWNYTYNRLGGGKVSCGSGCTLDPTTGRVSVGGGVEVKIKGKTVGGVDVDTSIGPEQSPDPHKILDWDLNVKVKAGSYNKTIVNKTGVVPAPAISRDLDPDIADVPEYRQLRRIDKLPGE